MAPVASLLAMDRTTLTAALKPLERRNRILKLTVKGNNLLARAVPLWKSTHDSVEQLIPDGDPEGLRGELRALS
jgi:DNA-binding MarR family transcriptional regulator